MNYFLPIPIHKGHISRCDVDLLRDRPKTLVPRDALLSYLGTRDAGPAQMSCIFNEDINIVLFSCSRLFAYPSVVLYFLCLVIISLLYGLPYQLLVTII